MAHQLLVPQECLLSLEVTNPSQTDCKQLLVAQLGLEIQQRVVLERVDLLLAQTAQTGLVPEQVSLLEVEVRLVELLLKSWHHHLLALALDLLRFLLDGGAIYTEKCGYRQSYQLEEDV